MGIVIPFRPRSGAWLPTERAALLAVQRAFEQRGLIAGYQDGTADDGSPWRVFYDVMTGHFIAHVARFRGGYVLRRADRASRQIEDLHRLVEVAGSLIAGRHAAVHSG